jgi:hypothetical protein
LENVRVRDGVSVRLDVRYAPLIDGLEILRNVSDTPIIVKWEKKMKGKLFEHWFRAEIIIPLIIVELVAIYYLL